MIDFYCYVLNKHKHKHKKKGMWNMEHVPFFLCLCLFHLCYAYRTSVNQAFVIQSDNSFVPVTPGPRIHKHRHPRRAIMLFPKGGIIHMETVEIERALGQSTFKYLKDMLGQINF